jgi:hypothetical protein
MEIEYSKNEMWISYERGDVIFYVICDWWFWTETAGKHDFEWLELDINIKKAEWWIEGKDGVHQMETTKQYEQWLLSQIEHMRIEEGFLFDEMIEQLDKIIHNNFYEYGI